MQGIDFKKFIITSSLFITLLFNYDFFTYFFSIKDNHFNFHNCYFVFGLYFLIITFLNLLILTIGQRYLLKPLIIILFFIGAIAKYFKSNYGVLINDDVIVSTFHTFLEKNYSELNDILNLKIFISIFVFAIIPSFIILRIKINYPSLYIKEIFQRIVIIIISFSILLIIIFGNYKNVSLIARKNNKILTQLIPTYAITSIYDVYKNYYKSDPEMKILVRSTQEDDLLDREIMILVIGETARADHFSLIGYEKNTNPLLSKKNIKIFNSATSCGTITAYSVPCIFYMDKYKDYNPSKAEFTQNVLDVINSTENHKVIWVENNSSCKHVCDRIETIDFMDIKSPRYTPNEFDYILVKEAKKILKENKSGDLLIILHTLGSHGPKYFKRYPEEFEYFKPVCKQNSPEECTREELINTYDNTIVYTDYILSELINLIKININPNDKAAMLYVSDHGESLGEKNIYLHGLPNSIAPREQKHIPIILWSNLTSKNVQIVENEVSHENIPVTLLDFFNLKTKIEFKTKSLFKF